MKKFLLFIFVLLLNICPVYCGVYVYEIYEEPQYEGKDIEENSVQNEENIITNEEKILDDETIYFDADKYEKVWLGDKIFQLQVEQNSNLFEQNIKDEGLNIDTKFTNTEIYKSKFNNKTTISSKTMTNSNIFSPKFSFGFGSEIKEFMPLPDTTNYSTISTSLYTDYKLKHLILESKLEYTNNVATDKSMNYFSFGPKINLTKSTAIKSSITKEFCSDNIYGEIAFIYKPLKSRRDTYFEINAWSNNTQYNVPQQRLQFYGKIKI